MNNLINMWSDNSSVSVVVWAVLIVASLYLGRTPAHQLIFNVSRNMRMAFRLMARSVRQMEERLVKRNKEVVLNAGQEAIERVIEREFHRVNAVVARDLSGYPALHRQINDTISKIEEEYHNSTETPPTPPQWDQAIEAVAKIPRNSNTKVDQILDEIQSSIEGAQKQTINEFRKSSLARHQLLKRMMPSWRSLDQNLSVVKTQITGLEERSNFIDTQMKRYEEIRRGEEQAARLLSSSSLTQFFVSGLVLVIAVLGGIINFQLIALPMSEMVGGASQLGPMKTADVAALVIIMVEVAMGLFLLESLRITRLFPVIGSMDDKMRTRMLIITLSILTILASVEASLAYMRDLLALDREALTQSLSGLSVVEAEFRWIPSMGQMIMGFVLPFTLAFVAIPLESFIQASRTVVGLGSELTLRLVHFVLRLFGNLIYQLGNTLIAIYDLIIFLPLRIEQLLSSRKYQKPITEIIEHVEEV